MLLVVVGGCGKHDGEKAKSASQVAVRVNTEDITVFQINDVLARANVPVSLQGRAKSEILEKLIDQQLAKQRALAEKLDRTPAVVRALEASRDEILARAYLDKLAGTVAKPTDEEIKNYYSLHPELFAERRIYNLEELIIEPKEGITAELSGQVKNSRNLQDVVAWLKAKGVKFGVNQGVRAAEALPMELVPKLHQLKDGEMIVVETAAGRESVFRVAASQSSPVNEAAASSRIKQFLTNEKVSKAVAGEMKSLRAKSDISYQGEFAGGAAAAEAKAKAEVEAAKLEEAKAKAEAEALAKRREEQRAQADAEAQARVAELAKTRAEAERRSAEERSQKKNSAPAAPVANDAIEKGLKGLK